VLEPVGVGVEEGVDVACGRALASARLVREMRERENFILERSVELSHAVDDAQVRILLLYIIPQVRTLEKDHGYETGTGSVQIFGQDATSQFCKWRQLHLIEVKLSSSDEVRSIAKVV
jgi:hypothetical protein